MSRILSARIVGALVLLAVLVSFQLQVREHFPAFGILVFSATAALSLLLSLPELLVLLVCTLALLTWHPGADTEVVFALATSFVFYAVRNRIPVRMWIIALIATLVQGAVFYGIFFADLERALLGRAFDTAFSTVILPSLFVSSMFGLLIFLVFRYIYEIKT